ncbi:MAG TPA: Gfo/Idh/MocA family oxidoreductase [Blastocatellia bacterium]|nr:Gfo/Idh/MocA family oxidoreductase [Blastocatellia bacterium]
MTTNKNTRRDFIKSSVAGAAGIAISSRASSYAKIIGANDRVRVAFVGPGDRSKDALIPSFLRLAGELNFEPVAVCDIWNKRRDEGADFVATQADKLKVPISGEQLAKARNTDELYSMKNVDAVIIATADFQHAYHCMEAVRAGKDVYVEKPFANIMSDARDALKLVSKSKQIVQVGTQRRSTPSYMRANEFLKSGKFGDIVMAEMTWNVNQPGRWRRPKVVPTLREQDTDWKRYLINRPPDTFDARKYLEFRLFWPYSSGIPDQWMVHQIDTVHWFTGYDHPTSVVANGGIYLWRDGRTNFDTMTAVFDYGTAAKGGKGFQVIYSSRQTNSAGDVKEIYYSNGGSLNLDTNKIGPEGGLKENHAKAMGKEAFLLPEMSLVDEAPVKAETSASTGVDNSTLAHMRNWMECVRSRKTPNADIRAAYNHSVALCMTIAALHTGKRITFDDAKQDVVIG